MGYFPLAVRLTLRTKRRYSSSLSHGAVKQNGLVSSAARNENVVNTIEPSFLRLLVGIFTDGLTTDSQ